MVNKVLVLFLDRLDYFAAFEKVPYDLVYSARNFIPVLGLWTGGGGGVALYKRAKLPWLWTTLGPQLSFPQVCFSNTTQRKSAEKMWSFNDCSRTWVDIRRVGWIVQIYWLLSLTLMDFSPLVTTAALYQRGFQSVKTGVAQYKGIEFCTNLGTWTRGGRTIQGTHYTRGPTVVLELQWFHEQWDLCFTPPLDATPYQPSTK